MSNTPRRRYGTLALSSAAAIGLALFVTGCASKPQAKILGARGEVVPTPYYDPTGRVNQAPAAAPAAAPAPQIIYVQTPPATTQDQTIYVPAAPSRTIASPEAIDYSAKVIPTPALNDPIATPRVQPPVSQTLDLSDMEPPASVMPTRSTQEPIKLTAVEGYRELPTMDESSSITYTVKKGDNLWNIGKSYGVTGQEIAAANSIDPSKYLKIGQVLTIPPGGKLQDSALVGDASSSTSSSSGSSMPSMSARNSVAREAIPASGVYTVERGDSLWKIGMKYNMTLPTIQGLNPGVGDNLKIGDKVYLTESAARKAGVSATTASSSKSASMPSMSARSSSSPSSSHTPTGTTPIPASKQYTVAKGDSLWVISQKFGISIEKLKSINNMSNNKLMPGQVLLLENGAGPVDSTVASYTPAETYTPATDTYTPPLTAKTTVVATPTPAPAPAATAPVDLTQMTNLQHFTEPADTLKDIAEMYNSQVDWILKANPTVKGDADLKKMNMVLVPVHDVGTNH